MDLQGDVGQMEAHLGPFGDGVNLHTRLVHSLRRTCNRLKNCFGHTRWNSKVMWVKWKLILVRLEIMSISMQDRFTVCTECAIGLEIVLGTLDGTRMRRWSSGSSFQSIW
jgi:hypothetical protein